MKQAMRVMLVIVLLLLLVACGSDDTSDDTPAATATPASTDTPVPTATPEPFLSPDLPVISADNVSALSVMKEYPKNMDLSIGRHGELMLIEGTLGNNFALVLIDLLTGEEIPVGEGRNGPYLTSVSPNGTYLAYFPAETEAPDLRVWDINARETLTDLSLAGLGTVWRAAFSPDDRLLTLSTGQRLIYDLEAGEVVEHAIPNRSTSMVVEFTPDGTLLFSESNAYIVADSLDTYENVISWDQTFKTDSGSTYAPAVESLAISPDGAYVAFSTVVTRDQPSITVQIWDVASGEALHVAEVEIAGVPLGDRPDVWTLAFSPDSSLLAAGITPDDRMGYVQFYDVASGEKVFEMDAGADVRDIAFGLEGRILAVATMDITNGDVRLYGVP